MNVIFQRFWARNGRRFLRDERGAVLIYVTLAMAVFTGFSALAIDGSYLYLMKNRAQSAADAAALAGASQLPDQDAARLEAISFAEKNLAVADFGDVLASADVTPGTWDADAHTFTAGGASPDSIEVVIHMDEDNSNSLKLFFASLLGSNQGGVSVSAIATTTGGGFGAPACVHVLNESASGALTKSGTSGVNGLGCNIQVDSCHARAFTASGSGAISLGAPGVESGTFSICGGIQMSGTASVPNAPYTQANTGERLGDPFDRAPYDAMPAASEYAGCDFNNFSGSGSGSTAMSPGVYCGGISFSGSRTISFQPGTYYIKDGAFNVSGTSILSGRDVTFVMTGSSARVNFSGSGSYAFSAPDDGDYAGFVFYGDPNRPASSAHNVSGSTVEGYHGILYFPEGGLTLSGSTTASSLSGVANDCAVFIADTVTMSGSTAITASSQCSEYTETPPFQGGELALRLVR
ncbi:MAG: pilus assembly protein TadG-related protein [Dongiaceae bacterium]